MKSTLGSRLKRLEHLETLRRNVAGAPFGAPPNPIGSPVKLSVAEYRKMIAHAEKAQMQTSQDYGATA